MERLERITVILLAEQKAALVAIARAEGESVGSVVRRLIRAEMQRLGIARPPVLCTSETGH